MHTIYKVLIEGFWDTYKIETKFHDDVNIFIGKNGTGKTTFINILQGVLTANFILLSSLQFRRIEITLKNGRQRKKIRVVKIDDNLEYKSLSFQIGEKKFDLPFLDKFFPTSRPGRVHPRALAAIEEIRTEIDSLYRISYLSVHRELLDEVDDESHLPPGQRNRVNTVDKRLRKLMNDLTSYQLRLETEANALSKEFERQVLQSMLFDESIDILNLDEKRNIDLVNLKKGLTQAYKDLNVLSKEVQNDINVHVEKISKAVSTLNAFQLKDGKPLNINDLIPLILLRRTEKIIDLSKATEAKRSEIFKPINDYLKLLKSYINDKVFAINQRGGLTVEKGNKIFPASFLSSGEKQLIILLTEALMQEKQQFVYIADEPELSLHISWQRKIIPSIIQLNANAQLIVATHSPEIVGKYGDNIIDMENILSHE